MELAEVLHTLWSEVAMLIRGEAVLRTFGPMLIESTHGIDESASATGRR